MRSIHLVSTTNRGRYRQEPSDADNRRGGPGSARNAVRTCQGSGQPTGAPGRGLYGPARGWSVIDPARLHRLLRDLEAIERFEATARTGCTLGGWVSEGSA